MGTSAAVHGNAQRYLLLAPTVITTAVTGVVAVGTVVTPMLAGARYLAAQVKFTYGSGGTTADFYIQTSLDGGTTWFDIMNFNFTTASATKTSAVTTNIAPATQAFSATDGTLTSNTIVQGVIGDRIRLKYTTTGTYAGSTTVTVNALAKG